MAKLVKFPLILKDGVSVRTLEELREHFSINAIIKYHESGQLVKWLKTLAATDMSGQVTSINNDDPEIVQKLCDVFDIACTEAIWSEYRNSPTATDTQSTEQQYISQIEVKNLHLSNYQITNFGSSFLSSSFHSTHSFEIDWCVFEKCSRILSCDSQDKAVISHCQFNICRKNLFEFRDSNSTISECEFNDWRGDNLVGGNIPPEQLKGILGFPDTLIKFYKHDTCSNSIKKCTFNNALAYYDFLIATDIYQNTNSYVVWVTDCVFNNCITKRSSGKLIKHYASYRNIFNKEKQIQAINSENGKYTSDKVSYTVMETDPLGVKIGCTFHIDTALPSV